MLTRFTEQEQKRAAKEFYNLWKERSDEMKDTQSFWLDLLRMVYGVENPSQFISFEKTIPFENTTKRADGYIAKTKILIEQKGGDIDLSKAQQQSDGSWLRPDQQARRYANNLPYDEKPKYIITSNFKEIWIYDENRPHSDPEKILLKDLEKEYYRLQFIVEPENVHIKKEMELSIKAGEIIGEIYNALREQYKNPDDEETLKSLNKLCVRLVFCFYAEDAGLFGKKSAFYDYLNHYSAEDFREALKSLFNVLNQKEDERDEYLKPELAAFPYVNGGLFDGEDIEIPRITEEIRDLILEKASDDFNWNEISPTIFGAVFESTLNPETRRKGGMHYTSIENIHKVIDPLFYDDLCKEFEEIKNIKVTKTRNARIEEFRDKLASLTFLDPACGSGNFLTETYLSLRRLENEAIELMTNGQVMIGAFSPIKVQINQFYGIEINDFAVTVAKTALWIAESQMMQKTEEIMYQKLEFLPLKSYTNIVEGNALRIDWNNVVSAEKLSFMMGNPPFIGTKWMGKEQKEDTKFVLGDIKNYGTLDYVACWYIKAAEYIKDTKIRCAFVSTNSICQGEQVANLWEPMMNNGIQIHFAYKTFVWDSEANEKAHVHCIIVGFGISDDDIKDKYIFDGKDKKKVKNINPYLVDADNVFVRSCKVPLCDVPQMYIGIDYKDDGNYVMEEEEKDLFLEVCPEAKPLIRPYMSGRDFIQRKPRYCLWFKNADLSLVDKLSLVKERIKKVQEFRESCNSPDTRKFAKVPMEPTRYRYYNTDWNTDAIALPMVSSQNRKYIPMDVISKETIASGKILLIPNMTKYHFGVLTSNVHMSWMRAVAGRLKSDYSYANSLVYNTFPWPKINDANKEKIEKTAQAILDARAKYSNYSFAELYNDALMPSELRKAHQLNDRAVMQAYGFWGKLNSETECVAELMKMYQELVNGKE